MPICRSMSGLISGIQVKCVECVGKANLGNVVTPMPSSNTENKEVIFSTEQIAFSLSSRAGVGSSKTQVPFRMKG